MATRRGMVCRSRYLLALGFTIKLKEVEETGIQTKAISPLIASGRSLRRLLHLQPEGTFDVTYLLKRDDPYTQEYEHKATDIRLDLNAPTVTVSVTSAIRSRHRWQGQRHLPSSSTCFRAAYLRPL
ncbi:MAG: hypothetical protein ACLSB7_07810 [Parabacteroides distasonis]